jgi:hypothetical protein
MEAMKNYHQEFQREPYCRFGRYLAHYPRSYAQVERLRLSRMGVEDLGRRMRVSHLCAMQDWDTVCG